MEEIPQQFEANEHEAAAIAQLRAALGEIFRPNTMFLGHGTHIEWAQNILKVGLEAKGDDLWSTCITLFDGKLPYEQQPDERFRQILHWPHYNLPAVVVLAIPHESEERTGGSHYFNAVFEELPADDTVVNSPYRSSRVVPATYVRGYVDVEQRIFVANPLFEIKRPTVVSLPYPILPFIRRTPPNPAIRPDYSEADDFLE